MLCDKEACRLHPCFLPGGCVVVAGAPCVGQGQSTFFKLALLIVLEVLHTRWCAYSVLCNCAQDMEATTKRLIKDDLLVAMFRAVLERTPGTLLQACI